MVKKYYAATQLVSWKEEDGSFSDDLFKYRKDTKSVGFLPVFESELSLKIENPNSKVIELEEDLQY